MNDKEIIALYMSRDEKAIEYTRDKYSAYCFSIADKVLDNAEDNEECLNDVWLAVWNSIPPNNPASLSSYIGKITRNLSVKRLRAINRLKRGKSVTVCLDELSEALPSGESVEDSFEKSELKESLEKFIRGQAKINRNIFLCRYYYLDSIDEIAVRFGMTENQVKLRLFRMRKKLKDFLEKEGAV